ncbi:MAG: DUF885 domain-containing protein [Lachnospiraceae bacterium]|nr:DUF885 domain-containing protein [Lachnospiraceae bacterium]
MKKNSLKRVLIGALCLMGLAGVALFPQVQNQIGYHLGQFFGARGVYENPVEETDTGKDHAPLTKEQQAFEELLLSIFREEVKTDSVTLNYMLNQPKDYGVEMEKATFGPFSLEEMKKSRMIKENYLDALKKFSQKELTKDEKLTYEILEKYLTDEISYSGNYLYTETLGATTGIQAQLPVLLAEYRMKNAEDVEEYLALLTDLERYFGDIVAFEKEKSQAGLFMSDTSAESIIEQCKQFVAEEENNYLIKTFDERMKEIEGISPEEKEEFERRNRKTVENTVMPAYKKLIEGLEALKGTGKNEKGLCNVAGGKNYYAYLVRQQTGSDKDCEELDKMIDKELSVTTTRMAKLIASNPKLLEEAAAPEYKEQTPEEMLEKLQKVIEKDFPKEEQVNYEIKYVDKSLEKNLSPAFYLSPPFDAPEDNDIYINQYKDYEEKGLFPVLAHEGYPGHLYQNVYFSRNNFEPIRKLLNFPGYTEGWASYVENLSYEWTGFEDSLAELLADNAAAALCMYAKADLGINYYGWDFEETASFLKKYGVTRKEDVEKVYHTMIEEPASYMKYTVGYLEFKELKEQAKEKWGKEYSDLAFHKYVLDMGPCQFSILEKHLQ